MRRLAFVVFVCACAVALAAARASKEPRLSVKASDTPGRPMSAVSAAPDAAMSSAALFTDTVAVTLGSWTFDDLAGNPDPQGWTTIDLTVQIDTFFHVDDFSGLDGGSFGRLVPISGARSLWCGARPTDATACGYTSLPGYGNYWEQVFESRTFSVPEDAVVEYHLVMDVEAYYDNVHLEYLSPGAIWTTVSSFTGIGDFVVSDTIPYAQINGELKLRFRVSSDLGWSDEDGILDSDGAAIIDDITVSSSGTIDFQDFESEIPGALETADGDWRAGVLMPFGNYAGLFDGEAVLQEDTLVTNTTSLWGFFNGSTVDYGCGGHPEQLAVPYPFVPPDRPLGSMLYLNNIIVSPAMPVPEDLSSIIALHLEFDVYSDNSQSTVYYVFFVRSGSNGCWGPWKYDYYVYFGAQKAWERKTISIKSYIDTNEEEFQVAIGAMNMPPNYNIDVCHSHTPLVDNVRVARLDLINEFVVTNTNPTGPGSLNAAIADANALLSKSLIRFDVPGFWPIIDCSTYPLDTLVSQVIIDGTTQPGYNGSPLIWLLSGSLQVDGGNSEIAGLWFIGPGTGDGVSLRSDGNLLRDNIISEFARGVWIDGNDNTIGGASGSEWNQLYANGTGVYVNSGTGNAIRGNLIHENTSLGIDLSPGGVTANDAGDGDTGANMLQNYAVVSQAVAHVAATTVTGTLDSSPNTTFLIDCYMSDSCHAGGYGEAYSYLGSSSVSTNEAGFVSFDFDTPLPSIVGWQLTTTATDPGGNTSEFSACVEIINTPGGVEVVTVPVDETTGETPAVITFDYVTEAGITTLETTTEGPEPPAAFTVGDSLYYEISTTAIFTGIIEVCLAYDESGLAVPEFDLRLLHWDETLATPAWVDVTTSLNTTDNVICGETDNLSPFIIGAGSVTHADLQPPARFALRQNVPNPFNPVTTISYDVPGKGAEVYLAIYDITGRCVRVLVNGYVVAGMRQATWDGRNESGNPVASGLYFCHMAAAQFEQTRKLVLLR